MLHKHSKELSSIKSDTAPFFSANEAKGKMSTTYYIDFGVVVE